MNVIFNTVEKIAIILTLVGALNWGLVGLFNFDLVASLCKEYLTLKRTIYSAVGISALYLIIIQIAGILDITLFHNVEKDKSSL